MGSKSTSAVLGKVSSSCLICDAQTDRSPKNDNGSSGMHARTLAALVRYPNQVKMYLMALCDGAPHDGCGSFSQLQKPICNYHEFENSVFCASCAKRLGTVYEIFEKLVELQKKVDGFQKVIGRDLRRCCVKTEKSLQA